MSEQVVLCKMWLKHCINYSLENNTFPFLISLTSVIFGIYKTIFT